MIIGTAGHIDHGKTALVRALTGVDTDRLKEEKARGISIDLGFAYMPAPDGSIIGFVDVPGHERFIHNMLAGVSGIDCALLVVAGDDGIMPQTVEHLSILDLLGVTRGIVALSKSDVCSQQTRARRLLEIEQLLSKTALAGAPIIAVSALSGAGIAELRAAIYAAKQTLAPRRSSGRFRMVIDRCFVLAGAGTIVTGTVLSGSVTLGDRVMISPSGLHARVRSIHAQNHPAERGRAGERCALNLVGEGVGKEAIARGDVVLDPELHAPTARIDAFLTVLASEQRPIGQWLPVRFHCGAVECGARVVLLGDAPLAPGTKGWVQLVLDRPVAAAAGDRFILRDTSAQRTIGGGTLVDLRAPARKRSTPERLATLAAMAEADPACAVATLLRVRPGVVDLSAFARDRALAPAEIDAIVEQQGLVRFTTQDRTFALSPEGRAAFREEVLTKLAAFHAENPDLQGIGCERLRAMLAMRLPPALFLAALQDLANRGEIVRDGAWVRLPHHHVQLTAEQEALWQKIRPYLGGKERFRPPRVRDIAGFLHYPEANIRRMLKLASRLGWVDEIALDHFFLRETVAEIIRIMQDLARRQADGAFTAAQLRDVLGNGRKVAIQILEFFDRHGVTFRRGDWRRINPLRLDLFAPPQASAFMLRQEKEGRETPPVGRPDFKSGRGRKPVLGGFDPHSLPPARGKTS
jgi:selenocysteine-specific elongation factor